MIERRTWEEFRETGLVKIINVIIRAFGWSIYYEYTNDKKFVQVYPIRCKHMRLGDASMTKAYLNLAKWMNENSEELVKDFEP